MKQKLRKRIVSALAGLISISAIVTSANAATITLNDSLTPKISYNGSSEINYVYYTNSKGINIPLKDGDKISGSYQGNYECYALAAFTYKGKFNKQLSETGYYDFGWSSNWDYLYLTERNAKRILQSIPIGSHIRINTQNRNQHSMIPSKITSTNISIYDANYYNDNVIDKRTYTYSSFVSSFPRLDYISNGTGSKGSNTAIATDIKPKSSYKRLMLTSTDGVTVSYNVNLDKAELSASFVYDNEASANHKKSMKIYYECINDNAVISPGSVTGTYYEKSYKNTKIKKLTATEINNLQYVDFDINITNVGSYSPYWAKCWH